VKAKKGDWKEKKGGGLALGQKKKFTTSRSESMSNRGLGTRGRRTGPPSWNQGGGETRGGARAMRSYLREEALQEVQHEGPLGRPEEVHVGGNKKGRDLLH